MELLYILSAIYVLPLPRGKLETILKSERHIFKPSVNSSLIKKEKSEKMGNDV